MAMKRITKKTTMVRCENMDTGVVFDLLPDDYECMKRNFKFIEYVEFIPGEFAAPATTDINQMNKTALLELANSMKGLEVSEKMTNAKLKEAIEDHRNKQDTPTI